jgi:hypothetical protein
MGIRMFIYPNVNIFHWGTKEFAGNYQKFLTNHFDVSKPPTSQHNPVDKAPSMGMAL